MSRSQWQRTPATEFAAALASQTWWQISTARRDRVEALLRVDRALDAVGDTGDQADLQLSPLDNGCSPCRGSIG
jgi:hypothetical protein